MVIAILFLLVLCYFGTKRVISVNIWNKWEITTDYFDIENTIDLFDTTQMHEIKILMTQEEYQDMIDTYASTSEKDWYKTDIIIDWVTIYDVWIRLKWNSSLRWFGWMWNWGPSISWIDRGKKNWFGSWDNRMWWFHWNRERGEFPWWMSWFNFSWDIKFPWAFEGWSFWPWMKSWDSVDYDSQLPLFIRFDKYTDQTYQWHTMISLRVWWMWSDETLLAEPYTYELYQEVGQPAPETSYGAVQIDWQDEKLFIISELPEDSYYVQKRFGDDNGVLYKAWNFVDFSYQWEDPTLYTDSFTQKTRVNDYDLAPLIRMLKFVTESTDEEFEEQIDDYIDVESVLTLLAIDTFVWNNDSFGWMGSNYYLYYHLWEQRFYLLTWDQNLAFGGMWWWMWWFGWMGWFNMWSWMDQNNVPLFKGDTGEAGEDFILSWSKKILSPSDSSFKKGAQDSSANASEWQNNRPQMGSWFQAPDDKNMPNMWWENGFEWMQMPSNFPWGWEFSWEMPNFQWGDFPWWWDFPWWDFNFNWEMSDFGWDMPSNFPWNGSWDKKWFSMWSNTLKTRLLANEKFKAMYDEIYAQIEEIALNTDFSENFFNERTTAFSKYHKSNELVSESSYSQWVEKLKSYLENKKD